MAVQSLRLAKFAANGTVSGVERLQAEARRIADVIEDRESSLAPLYWDLGEILNVLKDVTPHGAWKAVLAELGIHASRSSRARAIRRRFASRDDVAGLTVEEAYGQRQRIARQERKGRNLEPGSMMEFLMRTTAEADDWRDHVRTDGNDEECRRLEKLARDAAEAVATLASRIRERAQSRKSRMKS